MFQWQRQGVATDDEIGHTASYVCFASDDSDLVVIVDGASATHLVLSIMYSLLCVHAYMCVGACER